MPARQRRKRIGLCLNEKKKRKLNFHIFEELCRSRGYDVTDIDLARPLCTQGPLDLIIHKLSDLLVEAEQDLISHHLVQRLQVYLSSHPRTVLLDPLHALHTLLDRFQSYHLLRSLETQNEGADAVFSPPCVEISAMRSDVVTLVRTHLTFPIICKTRVAHGPRSHQMSLIFNEDGLSDVTPPCLLQSFINHSAALYKVFVVGSEHFMVQRPSVRNFPPGQTDQRTIFFNSHDVSKAESCSHLSQTTPCPEVRPPPGEVVNRVVRGLRSALGMSLFGVDLIVDTQSGRCAVIDVNAFPGYEGVPEFFPALLSHVDKVLAAGEGPPVNPHREAPRTPERPAEESPDLRGSVTAERWSKESDLPAPYKKNRACNPYFNLRTPSVSCDW
ncbi:inositol-tetrakisphosphate 1-kinase-like [Spea bombifrons]|uniref:inositol-tetrakisphosphate 1-kinase-like n=1 Tax=Spea bombifrons TaxID=233779 RepID=UPI00234AD40A|nr:inositol-tetrakisphosphate 1-kinase-like [Spea bombifrons]